MIDASKWNERGVEVVQVSSEGMKGLDGSFETGWREAPSPPPSISKPFIHRGGELKEINNRTDSLSINQNKSIEKHSRNLYIGSITTNRTCVIRKGCKMKRFFFFWNLCIELIMADFYFTEFVRRYFHAEIIKIMRVSLYSFEIKEKRR